jgi:hypothetical protein
MGKVVVYDEYEAPIWTTGLLWLSDGWVVEAYALPFAEMLVGDDA